MNAAQKREEEKQEELRLRKIEEELTQIEVNPQNADHFDRLVLSNPNSSFIWIKYMACHLQVRKKFDLSCSLAKFISILSIYIYSYMYILIYRVLKLKKQGQ